MHRQIFLAGLMIIAAGIPSSRFLMSAGQFIILFNWLAEGKLKQKCLAFFRNKTAVILVSVYLLHIIGLSYTDDLEYAFNDLRVKLPLLGLPIIFSSAEQLSSKSFRQLLWVFAGSCLLTSLISTIAYAGWLPGVVIENPHDISLFISHIRFSLSVVLSIIILLWLIFHDQQQRKLHAVYALLSVWFFVFLFLLESLTGIIVFFLTAFLLLGRYIFLYQKKKTIMFSFSFLLILICGILGGYIYKTIDDFYKTKDNLNALEQYTRNGEPYRHNLQNAEKENGHFVWIYFAENELRKAWNKRSKISYDSLDRRGQPLYATLSRYLTSKGLRKDSAGVSALSDGEIHAIENGTANADFLSINPFKKRIIQISQEINNYRLSHNPEGNSVTQRIEFWKTAWHIIQKHPLFGVGTGDLQLAFDRQYREDRTQLSEKYRLRAHNQYITMAVAFGATGFCWFLFAFLYPLFFAHYRHFLYLGWSIIAALSMLNEDTLETQAGMTFFAFFACLFLFLKPRNYD